MSVTRPLLDEGVPLRRRGRPRDGDDRESIARLSVSMPASLKKALQAEAKRRGVTLSAMIAATMAEAINDDQLKAA